MTFRFLYLLFCAGITAGIAMADVRGWVLTAATKGGMGRSYSGINHK